jgi:hypothetical protein
MKENTKYTLTFIGFATSGLWGIPTLLVSPLFVIPCFLQVGLSLYYKPSEHSHNTTRRTK